MKCKSCSFDGDSEVYKVREMQLGLREVFEYQLCSNCGCMQLLDIPEDLGKYYPSDKYYSFNTTMKKGVKNDPLRTLKASYLLYGKNKILGGLLSLGYKAPAYFDWMKTANIGFNDSILDVGCGDGGLLVSLCKNGFTNLTGIDPFNPADLDYGGVKIYKKDLFEMEGSYDLIMLNHVFEHLGEPKKVLKKLYELLKPQRYLLIRTPVMGGYGWKKYKEDWMAVEAPRHLIIHSLKSMNLLAQEAGFEIKRTVFDGTAYTLVASEQYLKDIPLIDPNSWIVNKASTLFTKREIDQYEEIARKANE